MRENRQGTMERLCVVMPVYNEREAIGPVLVKWSRALDELGIDYVIRPYNDGSKDDSLAVMRDCARTLTHVEVRDKPNGGHGHTILTGYRDAINDGFDWIFQIDSDDEMGPDGFAGLWNKRENHDFLIGIRDGRRQPLPRKIMSFVSRLCVRIFYGRGVWDVNTPYRLMRVSAFRDLIFRIPHRTFAPNVIISGLAAAYGLRSFETRVPQHDRTTGEVSIRKWKLAKAAMKSFWQTICFALVESGGFWLMFRRGCCLTVCGLGLFFCVTALVNGVGLVVATLACVILAGRRIWGPWVNRICLWMEKHPVEMLLILLAGAIALRYKIIASSDVPTLLLPSRGDARFFWKYAKIMAAGSFPDVKSWMSIGAYALIIKTFGENLKIAACFNMGCHFLVALAIFGFAARVFGRLSGYVAVAAFLLYKPLAFQMFHPCSEPLFFAFLASTFYVMARWNATRSVVWAILLPVCAWAAVWTKGEGILLLLVIPAWLCMVAFCVCGSGRVWVVLAAFALISLCLATGAMAVNMHYHGTRTFLCSEDNLWPRLFGSNVRYGGRLHKDCPGQRPSDQILIMERYLHDHPGNPEKVRLLHNQCPRQLVPYIKAEIRNRWQGLSLVEKISFMWRKNNRIFGLRRDDWFGAAVLIGAMVGLCFLFRMFQCGRPMTGMMLLRLVPLFYLLGFFCITALCEVNHRYRLVLYVCLPMYAALPLASGRERGPDV